MAKDRFKEHVALAAKNLDLDVVLESAEGDEYLGFCVACGAERGECEPDATEYPCHECEQFTVYGAEELVMMLV